MSDAVDAPKDGKKRVRVSQSQIPVYSLEKALAVAQALVDQFAAKDAEPYQIAMALGVSPTSGHWRNLCGSALAYGLTTGSYGAGQFGLTDLGRAAVAAKSEPERVQALVAATLRPAVAKAFFGKYDKNKLPSEAIAYSVLETLNVPKDRTSRTFELLRENGQFAGLIQETKTGLFVAIPTMKANSSLAPEEEVQEEPEEEESPEEFAKQIAGLPTIPVSKDEVKELRNNRVFISHGKNQRIVEQLKDIIRFGKYEPVIAVENETLAKPVPDKVMDDMRSCFAGVINIHGEGEMLDSAGAKHTVFNDNVLVEIGAAMALYGRNFVLLVQKGLELPSNLQGLYRCEYDGEALDYDATMKLLKTFNEFR